MSSFLATPGAQGDLTKGDLKGGFRGGNSWGIGTFQLELQRGAEGERFNKRRYDENYNLLQPFPQHFTTMIFSQ